MSGKIGRHETREENLWKWQTNKNEQMCVWLPAMRGEQPAGKEEPVDDRKKPLILGAFSRVRLLETNQSQIERGSRRHRKTSSSRLPRKKKQVEPTDGGGSARYASIRQLRRPRRFFFFFRSIKEFSLDVRLFFSEKNKSKQWGFRSITGHNLPVLSDLFWSKKEMRFSFTDGPLSAGRIEYTWWPAALTWIFFFQSPNWCTRKTYGDALQCAINNIVFPINSKQTNNDVYQTYINMDDKSIQNSRKHLEPLYNGTLIWNETR